MKKLFEYGGLTMYRGMEGFVVVQEFGNTSLSQVLPFAEGDKMAIAFRPGFDPLRDDPEALAIAAIPPHPDD
jgi:hypothetical protein